MTPTVMNFLKDITLHEKTEIDESANSSGPESPSSSERSKVMLVGCGESSSMILAKAALIAPSSQIILVTKAQSLSDRLTPSLISLGLVKGITPTSMRRRSGQRILDFASLPPDGDDLNEEQKNLD